MLQAGPRRCNRSFVPDTKDKRQRNNKWKDVINNTEYKVDIILDNINLMIITGGMQHIYYSEIYHEILLEMKLYKLYIEKNIKIFCICLVFQLR